MKKHCLTFFILLFAVNTIYAQNNVILSENFEDDSMDSRISIQTIGSFSSIPGIKDIQSFGSQKAFGFGRSTCSASCFNSYVTKVIITFPNPVFVDSMRFGEMELFGNWGAKGQIYVNNIYLPESDFGRTPSNDGVADTEYRNRNFPVDTTVHALEIRVWDITTSSEIFIDDLRIFGVDKNTSLDSSLILYYPFNGNADDETGNQINGIVQGAQLTSDRFGNPSSAYLFDGINDYIVADASKLPTSERTISLWFNANSVDNRPGLLGYGGGGGPTSWFMGINIHGSNSYHMSCHYGGNSIDYFYTDPPINKWYHWVITVSISGTKIYINGSERKSNSNFINNTVVDGKKIGIGTIAGPSGTVPYEDINVKYFNGIIDDIRIYSRALNAEEIKLLFDKESLENPVEPPSHPKDLKVEIEANQTTLTWKPNTESDVQYYHIYRDLYSPPTTLIDSVEVGINMYIDTAIISGKTYFYRITAVDKDLNESDFSNEVSSFVKKYPDLKVTLVETPPQILSGESFEVSWQVSNMGKEGTQLPEWFDKVYLSTSAEFDPNNSTVLGEFENFSYLSINEAYRNTAQFKLPKDIFGTHYIHIITDSKKQLSESDESNNTGSSNSITVNLSPFPDLEVTSVLTQDIAFSGDTIDITYKVKNTGTVKTEKEQWIDRIYLSEDDNLEIIPTILQGIWRINETPLGIFKHDGILEKDSSYTATTKIRIPHTIFGTYHIFVHTDALEKCSTPAHPNDCFIFDNNDVYEYNQEFDNWNSNPIQIVLSDLPDLVVTEIMTPANANLGEDIEIEWTVQNQGLNNTFESIWNDQIYISSSPTFDSELATVLGTFSHSGVLKRDSLYSNKVSVTIPGGFSNPSYIYIKTDCNNQVFENNFEDNNVSKDDTTIDINNPDFTIAEVTAPSTAGSGKTIDVIWKVRNQGEGSLYNGSWSDKIYLSKSTVFNTDSVTELGTWSFSGNHFKDSIYSTEKSVILPNGIEGQYYIFIETDYDNQVFEAGFEENNIEHSVSPIKVNLSPWADLVISSVSAPDETKAGERITITWDVKNEGEASVSGTSWTDRIYLTENETFDQDAKLLKSVEVSRTLDPASFYSRSEIVSLSTDLAGEYYVFLVTDANNNIYEHKDEGNNIFSAGGITIDPYPPIDLTAISISVPDSGSSWNPLNIKWSVQNIGAGKTLVSNWSDAFFLSADEQFNRDEDILVKRFSHTGSLKPGDLYSRNENVKLPDIDGNYYAIIETDTRFNTDDVDNGNNYIVSTNPIHITLSPQADLQVTSLTAPPTATAGQPVTVEFKVENNGDGNTNTFRWYDDFYLSANTRLDTTDICLTNYARNGVLASDEFYKDALEMEIPVYTIGDYFIIVKTDNRDDVYERNAENNNIRVIPISVTVPPPSDLIVTGITVPASATPGEEITVNWTVENIGENAAVGRMRDAVYISADENWQVEDALLGVVTRDINIPPGSNLKMAQKFSLAKTFKADAEGNITEQLPGVIPGEYHAIVRTDIRNNIRESNIYNNTSTSKDSISTNIPLLEIGVTAEGTLFNGQNVYYRIENSQERKTLKITLLSDDKNAVNEMFLKIEDVPDKITFDFKNKDPFDADQVIVVPSVHLGTYYLMLSNNFLDKDSLHYSLSAEILDFGVESIDIHEGGQGGNVTIGIIGSNFKQNIAVSLENNETTLQASEIYYFDATQIFVTFDLSNISLGTYDLKLLQNESYFKYHDDLDNPIELVEDSNLVVLQNTFSVIEQSNIPIEISVDAPSHARAGNQIQININVINNSNNDILAPILILYGFPYFKSKFNDEKSLGPYRLVAVSETGPAGILRPDSKNTIKIQVKAPIMVDTLKVRVNTTEELGLDFDFNRELSAIGLSPVSAWQDATNVLSTKLTNGWKDYHRIIANTATKFKQDGYPNCDYRSLVIGSIKNEIPETLTNDSSILSFESNYYDISEVDRIENSKLKSLPDCDPTLIQKQREALFKVVAAWGVSGLHIAHNHLLRFLTNIGGTVVYPNNSGVSKTIRKTKTGIVRSYEDVNNVVSSKVRDILSERISNSDNYEKIEINDFLLSGVENQRPDFSSNGEFQSKDAADLFFSIKGMQVPTIVFVKNIKVNIASQNECKERTAYYSASLDYQFYDHYEFDENDAKKNDFNKWARNIQLCGSATPFHVYVRISDWISDYVNLPASTSEECCQDENDIDCDGIPNDQDEDIDGDGIPNEYDIDIDGDGKKNWEDDDMDGDGKKNGEDDDMDGDGKKNGCEDDDSDGDGLPDKNDPDINGNGIPNKDDPDMDGDGKPNDEDSDTDGDCLPDPDDPEPNGPKDGGPGDDIPIGQPKDPNEIEGSNGYGDKKWIAIVQILPYTIYFENDSSLATASAQLVKITQKLDSTLDVRTFRLGSFGFGNYVFNVPENSAFYTQRLDLRDSLGLFVDVSAGIDITKNEIFWQFKSIDPATGELPAFEGFLPVNDALGRGQGFVNYTISPKEDSQTGDIINAQAEIVFDKNAPMSTNIWFNTIDADPPVSQVLPLTQTQDLEYFMLQWSGTDVGSGIIEYSIYAKTNDEPYKLWTQNTPYSSNIFNSPSNGEYSFYSIAKDGAGNIEASPETYDAKTSVVTGIEENEFYITDNNILLNSYPNPFSSNIQINFELPVSSKVTIVIYDINGREVKTIVNDKYMPGKYSALWDGKNYAGGKVPTGIYFVQMRAGDFVGHDKIIYKN